MKEKKIIKEEIVASLFDGFDFKISWCKKWFYYRPKWKWDKFSRWLRKLKQKWTTGFAHEEAWDFLHWHSKVVIPRLKYIRKNHRGFPTHLGVDEILIVNDKTILPEKGNEESEKHFKEMSENWNEILDKIIWSFEHYDDSIDPIKPDDYDSRRRRIEYDDGSVSYEPLDDRPWDWTPIEKHLERVQEGLNLFGKHYLQIWD